MADIRPATKADFAEMTTAFTVALDNLTAVRNLIQPDNNHRRRRDRQDDRHRPPRGGRHNRTVNPNFESEAEGEADPFSDYRRKVDVPYFYGTMGVEEFLVWQVEVDRFFDIMEIPKHNQTKMVALRLKSVASVWWDKLVAQRQRQQKGPVRSWRRMKQLMNERFLPVKDETLSYKIEENLVPFVIESQPEIRDESKKATTDFEPTFELPAIEEPKTETLEVEAPKDETLDDTSVILVPIITFEKISGKKNGNLLTMTTSEQKTKEDVEKVEDVLDATKPLLQEVMKIKFEDDVFIPTIKTPNQNETIPGKVFVTSYPFEFDKVSLVWRRSRTHLSELDDFSTLLKSKNRFINQILKKEISINKLVAHQHPRESREDDFQVNSRTSSFQERVNDTGRIQALTRRLYDVWKRRKQVRKKYRKDCDRVCNKPKFRKQETFIITNIKGYIKRVDVTHSYNENSGSSSFEVEETDVERITTRIKETIMHVFP